MPNIVIGTAGHVDHGKTSLVEALTGNNTDTLKDEKNQGITIQLGFTSINLAGQEVSIIDVPGHEKFLNHMVCGVHGIDIFMLVIAADDGIMPQTIEHLQIMHLLGVDKCVVVFNKCDVVEDEWLQLVKTETFDIFAKYQVKPIDICCVSAKTGLGINELKQSLTDIVQGISKTKKIPNGTARLPIDRLFAIKGFGTIVAGTLKDGSLDIGSDVQIYPSKLTPKIRGMQSHSKDIKKALPGMRLAVNLSGIEKSQIKKGHVLTLKGAGKCSNILSVSLSVLDTFTRNIKNNTRVRFFCGANDVIGRIRLLDCNETMPGDEVFAQVILEEPICCKPDDRFVIRLYSPLETIGGGKIISLDTKRYKRFDDAVLSNFKTLSTGDAFSLVVAKCHDANGLVCVEDIAKELGIDEDKETVVGRLGSQKDITVIENNKHVFAGTVDNIKKASDEVCSYIEQYHNNNPYKPGVKRLDLLQTDKLNIACFSVLLEYLKQKSFIDFSDEFVKLPGFSIKRDEIFTKTQNKLIDLINTNGFCVYRIERTDFSESENNVLPDVLRALITDNSIEEISDDYYLTRTIVEDIKNRTREFCKKQGSDTLQVSDFRDMLDISRKYANLLMEYLSKQRFLEREGTTSTYKFLG